MNTIYRSEEGRKVVMELYDTVLAHWPVPYEQLHLDTRLGDTFVIASGSASSPPLVLLHGACSNAVSWIADVEAYSRCFRVYAVDRTGEPGRSAPTRPPRQGPAYADWLADVLNGLGADKAVLVGLSDGGWMALKFAIQYPQRADRLVLLATAGITAVRPWFIVRAMFLTMLGRRGAQAINRITFGNQPIDPGALRFMDAIMTHFVPQMGPEVLFTDEELRCLTMPVLSIGGARDALQSSQQIAARLRRLLPNVTAVVLPEFGHALVNLSGQILPLLMAEP